MSEELIYEEAKQYFDRKLKECGEGPGVADWNSVEAQEIRFEQISKVLPADDMSFSICDYGCGIGDYYIYLKKKYSNISYTGIDISKEIIAKAKKLSDGTFFAGHEITEHYDYIVTSGIFNAKQSASDEEWFQYIIKTIESFNDHADKGFAFNCLTKYSDEDHKKDYLYYTDPLIIFDYCKTHFSRNVALLHDYEIYDFTVLVRKVL